MSLGVIFPPADFTVVPREHDDAFVHVGAATVVFSLRKGEARYLCKRASTPALAHEAAREAIVREAEILDALGGRGAPKLVARGEDAAGPFVVMERLAMRPLEALPPSVVATVARAAFDALADVHDAGIVHGDVSPANVLASDDGARAALVDFGFARRAGDPAPSGAFRGTLAFAAPELARGEAVIDARADVFSLAASILAVASGTPPRSASNDAALLLAAGEHPIDDWAVASASALPPELGRALLACVAFDRNARPTSAREALSRGTSAPRP